MRRALLIAMAVSSLAILVIGYVLNEQQYSVGARRSRAVVEMAETWNGEIQFTSSYDALAPAGADTVGAEAAASAGSAETGAFDPNDQYWGLPRNEGYDLVAGSCGACHSMQLVMAQRRSAQRWDELIDWMVATQGMPPPAAAERQTIVSYLARNYGEDAR